MPTPFIIFAVILGVIWTLSGLATWANKQKEAERRARIREQIARTAGKSNPAAIAQRAQPQAQRMPPPPISRGIAARFPDVLLPPTPSQRRPPQVRAQQQPRGPRPFPKKPQRKQQQQRQSAPIAPPPLAAAPTPPQAPDAAPVARTAAAAASTASPRITAAMLSKWMTPNTLNQQFLITEIFQPPLGLRDRHL
jgi:hypothetical protein